MAEAAVATVPRKIGAPSLYREEYCEQIITYFEAAEQQEGRTLHEKTVESQKDGRKDEMRRITAALPTLEGFARSIGTSRKTLLDWQNRHPAFSSACARAKDIQCALLTDRALNGQYNAQYAQFVAKNVTWMKDKVEVETVNSQDSQDMAGMRAALAAATPDELAQIAGLFDKIQSRANLPAIEESTT